MGQNIKMKIPWNDIEELTKYLKKKGLSEISIETKEGKITIRKDVQGVVSSVDVDKEIKTGKEELKSHAELKSSLNEVKAPMVGTFYSAASPGAEPFVQVGSKVKKGDVLCIIEAMKIMNELPSEISGTIKEILANDADVVEYGQVIFRIEP